jgi:hypothetical protein
VKIEVVKDRVWLDDRPFVDVAQVKIVERYLCEVPSPSDGTATITFTTIVEAEAVAFRERHPAALIFKKLEVQMPWLEVTPEYDETKEEDDQ